MKVRYESAADAYLIPISDPALQAKLQRDPWLLRQDHKLNAQAMRALREGPSVLPSAGGANVIDLEEEDEPRDEALVVRINQLAKLAGVSGPSVFYDHAWRLKFAPDGVNRILVLGCGEGHELLALRARYPNASMKAVDWSNSLSPRMVSATGVHFEADNLDDHQEQGTYDLVFSNHLIEHFFDPGTMLSRIADWVDDSGALLSGLPLDGAADDGFRPCLQAWAADPQALTWLDLGRVDPGHPWKTNPGNLSHTLRQAGFADVVIYQRSYAQTRLRKESGDELQERRKRLLRQNERIFGIVRRLLLNYGHDHRIRRCFYALASRLPFGDSRLRSSQLREVTFLASKQSLSAPRGSSDLTSALVHLALNKIET